MRKCILVDLDGTLSLFDREKKNPYHRDFENDAVSKPVKMVVDMYMNVHPSRTVFFVSGRSGKYRKQTLQFLEEKAAMGKEGFHFELIMREEGDNRKDSIIKEEIYEKIIKPKYEVDFVIDDRKQVKEMWVSKGVFVFDVNQTDEIF